MKRFLLPAFALALAVNANATSFQANMSAGQHEAQVADGSKTFSGDMSVYNKGNDFLMGTTEKSIIIVTKESDGKYTLVLKDFSVAGANVGDATVSNIEGNVNKGTVTLEATNVDAVITNGLNEDPISPIEKVSMTMTASISGDYLIADISEVSVPGIGSFYAKFKDISINFTL